MRGLFYMSVLGVLVYYHFFNYGFISRVQPYKVNARAVTAKIVLHNTTAELLQVFVHQLAAHKVVYFNVCIFGFS